MQTSAHPLSDPFSVRSAAVAPGSLAGAKVLVMGLGRFGGGVGVARWLAGQGAVVTVTDSAPADQLSESIGALAGLPVTFRLGGHDAGDFLSADLIVVNPAVDRHKSPELRAGIEKGVATTTEMNLFVERCPATTIGITGSVGKSTTTALIHQALQAALTAPDAPRVFLGGNIGRSLLLELAAIRPRDYVVLELSSFMLEETPALNWSPHLAVVTNLFPNHLDRHGTMALYSAAKQNLLRFQSPHDIAILNGDHELVSRWVHLARGKVMKFTTRGPRPSASNSLPPLHDPHKLPPLLIPGEHNESNAAAAVAVVDALATYHRIAPHCRFDRAAALRAIGEFPGLPHRLQLVHTLDFAAGTSPARVLRFYNDSKATTPEASITALLAFPPQTAIFIVGGYDKQIDLSPFEELLARRAAGIIGIGATGPAIIGHVGQIAASGAMPPPRLEVAGSLEVAVPLAMRWARESGADKPVAAIVLSPASASWDQFPNYEVRGQRFIELSRQN